MNKMGSYGNGYYVLASNVQTAATEPRIINDLTMKAFEKRLRELEKSDATIEKYLRDINSFRRWLEKQPSKCPDVTVTEETEMPSAAASLQAKAEMPSAATILQVEKEMPSAATILQAEKEMPDAARCPVIASERNTVRNADNSSTYASSCTCTQCIATLTACVADKNKSVNKDAIIAYKKHIHMHYKLSSVNSMLSALNTFFRQMEWWECRVTTYKVQHSVFRSPEKELSIEEFRRLVNAARDKGDEQLTLIMETLAKTGIRISELSSITISSLLQRRAIVSLKGKTREVILPDDLCKSLEIFCKKHGICTGPVFLTRGGKPVDRTNIYHKMKRLAESSHVAREKIYPHNLRHLFAVTYYQQEKDIVRLADVLGHSNINTTRIYTRISSETQRGVLEKISALITPTEEKTLCRLL